MRADRAPPLILDGKLPRLGNKAETDSMTAPHDERTRCMPLGVVVRRTPGVTRWARWSWRPVAVLPGAAEADWKVLRQEGDAVEYLAGVRTLELHRADAEAYHANLVTEEPSIYVVMRPKGPDQPGPEGVDYTLTSVTASPYEAQDDLDSASELVERVPMTPGLMAWIEEFVDAHYTDEPFRKRRRRPWVDAPREDGRGDSRIRQAADVYRSPASMRSAPTGDGEE